MLLRVLERAATWKEPLPSVLIFPRGVLDPHRLMGQICVLNVLKMLTITSYKI